MSITIWWPMISSFFLRLSRKSFTIFLSLFLILVSTLSWVPSAQLLFGGAKPSFNKAATDQDDGSSSPYHSFHLHSFFFDEWCDSWGSHGTTSVHRCSPWYSYYWVVLDEQPCWSYCTIIGLPWWIRCFSISFSRGFWGWGCYWWWWWW